MTPAWRRCFELSGREFGPESSARVADLLGPAPTRLQKNRRPHAARHRDQVRHQSETKDETIVRIEPEHRPHHGAATDRDRCTTEALLQPGFLYLPSRRNGPLAR